MPKHVITLEVFWITWVILQSHIHFFNIAIRKRRPKYLVWFFIRGGTAAFYSWAFVNTGIEWYPLLGFMLCSHYLLFNPTLNKLRHIHNPMGGYSFWYLGKDSGWFDRVFLEYPKLHRLFYTACFFISIICAISIFEFFNVW